MLEVQPSKSAGNVNKATIQILEVLTHCIHYDGSFGVTEIANKLNINKSMAFRALQTLLEYDLVARDTSKGRYVLGFGALRFCSGASDFQFDIRNLCAPFLQRIHDVTGESVFVSVIIGRNHVTIDSVESHGIRVRRHPRGLLVPLHASPASRALLSFLSDEEIDEYIRVSSPLKRFTASTICDPGLLRKEISIVRSQKVARGYGDHYDNATYVSFPVLDAVGRPHAAITLGAPPDRLSNEDVERMLPVLTPIVDELNKQASMFYAESRILFG